MTLLGLLLVVLPVVTAGYAYVVYPLLLALVGRHRPLRLPEGDPAEWPGITITVPSFNEEASIRGTLEQILALDYPADRRHVLVISDASTDRTDDIVREFADRGVELLRQPERRGKTEAENAAAARLRGEIVVNVDATVRVAPDCLKPLIRVFQDPTTGVASGRDVSVGDQRVEASSAESGYVGYEMWLRDLETRAGGIVGASGCFYAIRRSIYDNIFPAALSRDFASPLLARRAGYRAVSVPKARVLVPRTPSLRAEYRRKVRTMARGLDTLWFTRDLLNPLRHGLFAWQLWSHKVARWLAFLFAPLFFVGLLFLVPSTTIASGLLGLSLVAALLGAIGWAWPGDRPPRGLGAFAFVLGSILAGLAAWRAAFRRERNPIWEPTRRPGSV